MSTPACPRQRTFVDVRSGLHLASECPREHVAETTGGWRSRQLVERLGGECGGIVQRHADSRRACSFQPRRHSVREACATLTSQAFALFTRGLGGYRHLAAGRLTDARAIRQVADGLLRQAAPMQTISRPPEHEPARSNARAIASLGGEAGSGHHGGCCSWAAQWPRPTHWSDATSCASLRNSPMTLLAFTRYRWPGDLRELFNVVELRA